MGPSLGTVKLLKALMKSMIYHVVECSLGFREKALHLYLKVMIIIRQQTSGIVQCWKCRNSNSLTRDLNLNIK